MNSIPNARSTTLLVISAMLAAICIGCSDDGTDPGNGPNGNGESLVWEEEYINRDDFHVRDVWIGPDGAGFAVGYQGSDGSRDQSVVLEYDGTEWTVNELAGVEHELTCVSGVTATDVHAVGYGGIALHCDGSGWQEENLPGEGLTVTQVSAGASDFAIALGHETLLRWNGSSWGEVESEINFDRVWAHSSDEAYLLASEGIYRIDRQGNFYPEVLTTYDLREIHGNAAGRIFVLGQQELYELVDDGLEEVFSDQNIDHFSDFWVASTGDVYIAVGEPHLGVLRYDGESGSVEQMTMPCCAGFGFGYTSSICGRSSTDIVAVSTHRRFAHCDGQTWAPMRVEPAQDVPALHAVHGNDHGSIWASSLDGGFYVSRGDGVWNRDGAYWSDYDYPVGPIWAHPDVVVRVRCHGEGCPPSYIMAFDPGNGDVLSAYEHETDAGLNGLWGTAEDDVFAVGSDARIFRFTGAAWDEMTDEVPSEATDTLRAISGASASEIYAVGDGGAVLRFDGAGWNVVAAGVTVDLNDVWVDAASATVYVVGADATVLVRDGTGWATMDVPEEVDADLNAVWGFGADDVYAFGEDGVAMRYDGTSWESLGMPTTEAIHDVWGTASGEIVAVCGDGRILRGEWK